MKRHESSSKDAVCSPIQVVSSPGATQGDCPDYMQLLCFSVMATVVSFPLQAESLQCGMKKQSARHLLCHWSSTSVMPCFA